MTAISEDTWDRFLRICGMLGSDCETERSLAAAHASKVLRSSGLAWSDVLRRPACDAPEDEFVTAFDIIKWCHERMSQIRSDWGLRFVNSLHKISERYGDGTELTDKQWTVIERIAKDIRRTAEGRDAGRES